MVDEPANRDPHSPAAVLFDVDGTLLDTNYLHVLAWSRALHECGYQMTMQQVHRYIGIGGREFIARVSGGRNETLSARYTVHYDSLRQDVWAFPWAAELLVACRDAGLRVVLATSAKREDIGTILPLLGIDEDVLTGATTASDVATTKPAPDLFLKAVETYGLDPERTVVVGDTLWDVQAAGHAGLPCLAVMCGGTCAADLRAAGAVEVYDDPADLLARLDRSLLGRLAHGSDPRP